MRPGSINAWVCDRCAAPTVSVDIEDGVTPMFLACRATPGCKGRAISRGYPKGEPPAEIIDALAWEWYRPTPKQARRMGADMAEHVAKGGLDLRPLTDAGRAAYSGRETSS